MLTFLKTKTPQILFGVFLVAGALLTWWMVQNADRDKRAALLQETRLVAQGVNLKLLQALTGTQADLTKPEYLQLKQQFNAIRSGNPQYHFIYLMGARDDATVFFFVDDRPVGDVEEAPAGMIYEDVPKEFRQVLNSNVGVVAGPFTDRWGSFVSGCVPLNDPETGKQLAILAVDFGANDWNLDVLARASLPVGLLLLLRIGVSISYAVTRQVKASTSPILVRLLLPQAVLLIILLVLISARFWQQQQQKLEERLASDTSRVSLDFARSLELQTANLSLLLQPIIYDPGVQTDLIKGDTAHLLSVRQPLFKTLQQDEQLTHFYFLDANRICLLRVHDPARFGDRIERFTALEAERIGKTASGIELGHMGTFTLRVVQPVFAGGKLVGYVEFGKEIEDILQTLQSRSGIQLAVVIRKQYLTQSLWEDGMRLLGRQPEWGRLPNSVVAYSSLGWNPDAFTAWADQSAAEVVQGPLSQKFSAGSQDWHAAALPLRDAAGKEVGALLVMLDITADNDTIPAR